MSTCDVLRELRTQARISTRPSNMRTADQCDGNSRIYCTNKNFINQVVSYARRTGYFVDEQEIFVEYWPPKSGGFEDEKDEEKIFVHETHSKSRKDCFEICLRSQYPVDSFGLKCLLSLHVCKNVSNRSVCFHCD